MAAKKEPDYFKLAAQLNKLQLKLYGFTVEDMIRVEHEKLSEEEITNRSADMHAFYHKGFKSQLEEMILTEMRTMTQAAETQAQVLFYRGSIAALVKLKAWCEAQIPPSKAKQQEGQPSAGGITL